MNSMSLISQVLNSFVSIASGGVVATSLKLALVVFIPVVVFFLTGKIKQWLNVSAEQSSQESAQQDQSKVVSETGQISQDADHAASDIDSIRSDK
jgi:UPF0716 family protein affecting phage T7 exclusion